MSTAQLPGMASGPTLRRPNPVTSRGRMTALLPLCTSNSGCPSRPPRPNPQVYTCPVSDTAQLWNLAAATATSRSGGGGCS
jgi:hypothetical protein